jgi:hypothetical protein
MPRVADPANDRRVSFGSGAFLTGVLNRHSRRTTRFADLTIILLQTEIKIRGAVLAVGCDGSTRWGQRPIRHGVNVRMWYGRSRTGIDHWRYLLPP